MYPDTHTVGQLRNALIALSNSKTKSVKKRMSYARVQKMLDYVGWADNQTVTFKDLCSIPSLGKKTVLTFLDELERSTCVR